MRVGETLSAIVDCFRGRIRHSPSTSKAVLLAVTVYTGSGLSGTWYTTWRPLQNANNSWLRRKCLKIKHVFSPHAPRSMLPGRHLHVCPQATPSSKRSFGTHQNPFAPEASKGRTEVQLNRTSRRSKRSGWLQTFRSCMTRFMRRLLSCWPFVS